MRGEGGGGETAFLSVQSKHVPGVGRGGGGGGLGLTHRNDQTGIHTYVYV